MVKKSIFVGIFSITALAVSQGVLTFSVTFTAQAQSDLSAAEQQMFQEALDFWDDLIIDHRDGATRNFELTVDTFDSAPSGGFITLGSAGPTFTDESNIVADAHTSDKRFILAVAGEASFNTNPAAGALHASTLRHEIGHALGIGTLWEENELQNDGDTGNDAQFGFDRTLAGGTPGHYVGPNGLAAYQLEYDAGAVFVPIERDGGGGTANGHWNEVADNPAVENSSGFDSDPGDGGPAATDLLGRSLDDELMTGFSSGDNYVSNTTILSLRDLGFNTIDPVFIPEPSGIALLAGSLLMLARRRRR